MIWESICEVMWAGQHLATAAGIVYALSSTAAGLGHR